MLLDRTDDPVNLPGWLTELPNIERIDAISTAIADAPAASHIRWTIRAEELDLFEYLTDLNNVDGIGIGPHTYAVTIDDIAVRCELGELELAKLRCGVNSLDVSKDQEALTREWKALDTLDNRIDSILRHQPSLEAADFFGCPLGRVPEPLSSLPRLTRLTLGAVWPETLPGWIFGLTELRNALIYYNGLRDLPDPVGPGRRLRHLVLDGNPLSSIPSWVWNLPELEHLSLRDCPVEELPQDLANAPNLTTLNIGSVFGSQQAPLALRVPPPEIAIQGLDAIRQYWRQQRSVGVDHLAEAKLLIVGEAGAGKTSFARKILDPDYVLDAYEDSTEGIDVMRWQFPGAVRVREDRAEYVKTCNLRINVWDFGGQEIYHSTHQFFLTKRSVYVLVTDERKEDTDFAYWLEIVDLLSDGSPVVIVQNRKQGRGQGLDLGALRQRYRNLVDTVSVDLADNSGLGDAVARIRRELEQLPHLGTPLPATWREVRLALEGDPHDHIAADEFFEICGRHGFTCRDDMEQLGGYLHDLGICLFFQDDSVLKRTVILKPEWGTDAVYRVLDDDAVTAAQGVFTEADLARIWHEDRFAPMRHELLALMERFGLCYRVPGSETWIAPQLLSPTRPVYAWPDDGNVVLRYEYDVMPKGIARRLIVALHDLLVPGDYVWRSGGVFTYRGTRAEVVEDHRRRHLHMRLHGVDPRVLLGIIDHALGVIHRSYPRLRYDTFLPCRCDVCVRAREPAMFTVAELEDFARTGDQIQCRTSRRLVDPRTVLDVLSPDDRRQLAVTTAPEPPAPRPEVFVSYKWKGAADALVDELQGRLGERGVPLVRDRSAMRYRDSIRGFMRRLGAGKYVVVVVDDAYLRSANCMFELTRIADDPAFADRVFPVILSDAAIFDPISRLDYIEHWEEQVNKLDAKLARVGPENLQGIHDERNLYETIRNTIARIVDVLADMNALTPETHRDSDFAELYRSLEVALTR